MPRRDVGTLILILALGTARADAAFVCPVTAPQGRNLPAGYPVNHGDGTGLAAIAFSPVVFKPGGPGCVARDGSLLMKWGWWRGVRGQLSVTGRSFEGKPGAVRVAFVPSGDIGFQPTALAFPGPGCWEVTGAVAEARVSFVVLVEKIAEGPGSRCEELFPRSALESLRVSVDPVGR